MVVKNRKVYISTSSLIIFSDNSGLTRFKNHPHNRRGSASFLLPAHNSSLESVSESWKFLVCVRFLKKQFSQFSNKSEV
jgi:hypothetical protein